MVIEVVRIGQRLVRDDRVTTHVALVSRAFGAERIFMSEINPEIKDTIEKINGTWGGKFEIEFIDKYNKPNYQLIKVSNTKMAIRKRVKIDDIISDL